MLFFQYYRERANYLERAYDLVERVGIKKIRKETVYATPRLQRDRVRRLAPRQRSEDRSLASLDTKTGGVRWVGKLPPARVDYGLEMAIQRGNIGADAVSAWAGHWVAGYTFPVAYTPRAFAEYNYASGDRNPHDGHIGTFDQLYPTGHDKFGLADQVGWRNIRDLHFGAEAKPKRSVTAAVGVCLRS